jgi:hypothetical protein
MAGTDLRPGGRLGTALELMKGFLCQCKTRGEDARWGYPISLENNAPLFILLSLKSSCGTEPLLRLLEYATKPL